MFDGLDEIDWTSMERAYGPAVELPDLIREPALPVLTAAWHGNEKTRTAIVESVSGPLPDELGPLLEAELTTSQRYGLSETGWSSTEVTDDERLLAACRAALEGE